MYKKILLPFILIGTLAATGCAVHQGHEKHVTSPTLGAELVDLKMALDKGAISKEEYQKIKRQLEHRLERQPG